jgi:hypothetical protein
MDEFEKNSTKLQKILMRMDVPAQRKHDYHWLARNLAIRNRNHPKIQEALVLVSILMESE